jgi:hypothetical protein
MFPSDAQVRAALAQPPQTIAQALDTMRAIDAALDDADGLKWFNWLYLQVTAAVEQRTGGAGFADPAWLAELDVQFARLYFEALSGWLRDGSAPGCWKALFARRRQPAVARIQFALAGINAHINHDLALAVVATCRAAGSTPAHDSVQYTDYTSVNHTLDGLIELAKTTLAVRLLGDALPAVSHLEDTIAAWNVAAAREAAWSHAEVLWQLRNQPLLRSRYLDALSGLTALAGKALLVPVPIGTAAGA